MNAIKKSFLAVTALFALTPTVGLALPLQCEDVCPATNDCDQECYVGYTHETTCAGYGWWFCATYGYGLSSGEPTLSTSRMESQGVEDSALVCSQEHPEAERTAASAS